MSEAKMASDSNENTREPSTGKTGVTKILLSMAMVILLSALAGAVFLAANHWSSKSQDFPPAQLELLKTCLSFLLTGVAAAVVAALIRLYEADRQDAAKKRDDIRQKQTSNLQYLRRQFSILLAIYNRAKFARRTLRARGRLVVTKTPIEYVFDEDVYQGIFDELEQIQLDLEIQKRTIRANVSTLAGVNVDGVELSNLAGVAEEFLRGVLREYEDRSHWREDKCVHIAAGSRAFAFIATARDRERYNIANTSQDEFFTPLGNIEDTATKRLSQDFTAAD
ncbi:hypothetical protein [Rhizobium sp. BK251]|uniref:hypothetical protein n=1 Tax=Rhizobium sp. BK251 TaxID=2512125 RepID=UPI0010485788|nr:hypothetical protein [Rhizobium sp. BK251]TCL68458.1 hypothetical protein EV286_109388 [Rhizobium sp. BK251]